MQSSMLLQPQLNHRMLLVILRKSIELWFLGRRDQVDGEYDYLYTDVQNAIIAVISHGLQLSMQSANNDRLHKFVDDLQWLTTSVLSKRIMLKYEPETPSLRDFLTSWVQEALNNNCLCSCLQMLVTDKEILNSYYTDYAFLQSEKYSTALFICVSAVELNQSSLLSQIEPILFTENFVQCKRAVSHPNLSMSPPKKATVKTSLDTSDSSSVKHFRLRSTIRKWNSLPAIKPQETKKRKRSHTLGNVRDVPVNVGRLHKALNKHDKMNIPNKQNAESLQSTSSSEYSRSTTESTGSSTVGIEIINCDDIKIWEDHSISKTAPDKRANKISPTVGTSTLDMNCDVRSQSCSSPSPINSFLSNIFSVTSFRPNSSSSYNDSSTSLYYSSSAQNDSVLNSFLPRCGEKLPARKSSNLFEDTSTPLHSKLGTSGQSVGDQSLAAFLQATQFSRCVNELERENAHFRICEAIISAIERMKCQKLEADNADKQSKSESIEKDIPGTSTQVYGSLSRVHAEEESFCAKEGTKTKFEETADISEHTPYAELGESSLDDLRSAENIGLSLISKFNDKHLPKVSDLKWLVSEEDTPQQLLPMPQKSNNPDENIAPMATRGTRYWAPPRQQIIFTNHPAPKRKFLIQKQNYRCAGCGMRVSASHIKSFRYCTYLGKYHCTGCHRNQISAIPAKVLQLWDFNFYPVSVFSYRLLEQMWTYPLFYVPDLNPALYTKSRALRNARLKRVQTQYVKEFITTCRFAEDEKIYFASLPDYISSDPDTWSMSDLIDAKTKTIHKSLQDLIRKCEDHIFDCVLCTARGFICEFCRKDTVIFPWQSKVLRCDKCGACFHFNCWKAQFACPKCQRLKFRHTET